MTPGPINLMDDENAIYIFLKTSALVGNLTMLKELCKEENSNAREGEIKTALLIFSNCLEVCNTMVQIFPIKDEQVILQTIQDIDMCCYKLFLLGHTEQSLLDRETIDVVLPTLVEKFTALKRLISYFPPAESVLEQLKESIKEGTVTAGNTISLIFQNLPIDRLPFTLPIQNSHSSEPLELEDLSNMPIKNL